MLIRKPHPDFKLSLHHPLVQDTMNILIGRRFVLVDLLSALHKLESSAKGEPQSRNYLYQTGLWARLLGFLFISNCCGWSQITEGSGTPEVYKSRN